MWMIWFVISHAQLGLTTILYRVPVDRENLEKVEEFNWSGKWWNSGKFYAAICGNVCTTGIWKSLLLYRCSVYSFMTHLIDQGRNKSSCVLYFSGGFLMVNGTALTVVWSSGRAPDILLLNYFRYLLGTWPVLWYGNCRKEGWLKKNWVKEHSFLSWWLLFCSLEDQSFLQLLAEHGAVMLWPSLLQKDCCGLFLVMCTTGTSLFFQKNLNILLHKVCIEYLLCFCCMQLSVLLFWTRTY